MPLSQDLSGKALAQGRVLQLLRPAGHIGGGILLAGRRKGFAMEGVAGARRRSANFGPGTMKA